MTRNLHDKVIVITGASSGIGKATALACAKAGMHVTLAARRADKLETVAKQIRDLGRQALVVPCDVDHDDDVSELFAKSWDHFSRLDAVFANAGYGLFASVMDTTDAQHRAIFETNYFGTIRCIHTGVPYLRKTPDGLKHLLICSSAASEIGLPMYGAYAATKAAQDSIAGALRAELAIENIRVTSVHPVGTRTDFFDVAAQKAGHPDAQGKHNTPANLSQTPAHVANRILAALRKPRAEVWPMLSVRIGLGIATILPGLANWTIARKSRTLIKQWSRVTPDSP